MADVHNKNKELIAQLRGCLYDIEPERLKGQLEDIFAADCDIHLSSPFEDIAGPAEFYERVYAPLLVAIPDLERRDFIMMAGDAVEDTNWVGCAGNYVGVFEKHWLDIPPTYGMVAMRFHEFYRIVDGKIVEMQAIWDIPHLMMQADAWPMMPSLGVNWVAPAPAVQNGLSLPERDPEASAASQQLIIDMLDGLQRHAEFGPEGMGLDKFWHPKMTWYGPAGIGMNRRISGFRNWHQIPFLKGMPDRDMNHEVNNYFFGDGDYVGVTAWSGMRLTISEDGWLGIPPVGKEILMRSLDFWRCEKGLIRENWVLVDILHVYDQIGVDVFSRMRELTVARQPNRPENLTWGGKFQ